MKKVLIAYFSLTGKTRTMAEYIAEGVRISGHDAEARKISEIASEKDMEGYDGYIFGCPTYHRDMTDNMKTFPSWRECRPGRRREGLSGPTRHSGDAPDTYSTPWSMSSDEPGEARSLSPERAHRRHDEGLRACQQYGRAVGEMLGFEGDEVSGQYPPSETW